MTNAKINPRDKGGYTPLHLAAVNGNQQNICNICSNMRADAKITDNNLNTPLHIATIEGNFELVNTIVGFNMDANMVRCRRMKNTPLHYAAEIGYYNIVRVASRCWS